MSSPVSILIASFGIIFVIGQIGRIPILGSIVNVLDVMVLFCSGIFFFKFLSRKKKDLPALRLLLAFTSLSLFSLIFYSIKYDLNAFFVSSLYLLRLLSYWLLFYLLVLTPNIGKAIRKTMIISGALIVIVGFVQYFFYPNLRNLFYLGWDEHLFRMFSTFLDPNFAGAFFAIFFFFSLKFLLSSKKRVERMITGSISLLTLIALFLTYSRTAIIMLIVGVIAFSFVYGKRKQAIVVVGLLLVGYLSFANKGIEGLNPLRIASATARLETIRNGLQIFVQNPVIGIGFNSYRSEQIRLGYRIGEAAKISHADAGVDNSYVFLLATTGVLGFVIYVLFVRGVVLYSLRKINRLERAVAASMIVSFLIGGLFINLVFYPPVLLFIVSFLGTIQSKKF